MNTSTVAQPRTAAALAARRGSTQAAIGRVHDAISWLRREKTPVTVAAVSRRAGVSRTFLYENPEARSAVAAAIADTDERRGQALADLDNQHEAAWRERALNAEDALKATNAEILNQRTRIGELLGQIRDLESEWTEEAIQRITTENTTLKQRVRQLTTDNRTLEERLKLPARTCASRTAVSPTWRRSSPIRTRSPDHDAPHHPSPRPGHRPGGRAVSQDHPNRRPRSAPGTVTDM